MGYGILLLLSLLPAYYVFRAESVHQSLNLGSQLASNEAFVGASILYIIHKVQ